MRVTNEKLPLNYDQLLYNQGQIRSNWVYLHTTA